MLCKIIALDAGSRGDFPVAEFVAFLSRRMDPTSTPQQLAHECAQIDQFRRHPHYIRYLMQLGDVAKQQFLYQLQLLYNISPDTLSVAIRTGRPLVGSDAGLSASAWNVPIVMGGYPDPVVMPAELLLIMFGWGIKRAIENQLRR